MSDDPYAAFSTPDPVAPPPAPAATPALPADPTLGGGAVRHAKYPQWILNADGSVRGSGDLSPDSPDASGEIEIKGSTDPQNAAEFVAAHPDFYATSGFGPTAALGAPKGSANQAPPTVPTPDGGGFAPPVAAPAAPADPYAAFSSADPNQTAAGAPLKSDDGAGVVEGFLTPGEHALRWLDNTVKDVPVLGDAVEGAAKAITSLPDINGQANPQTLTQALDSADGYDSDLASQGKAPGALGKFGGEVLGTLPTMVGSGVAAVLGGGAAAGALLSDAKDPLGILRDGALGAAGAGIFHAAPFIDGYIAKRIAPTSDWLAQLAAGPGGRGVGAVAGKELGAPAAPDSSNAMSEAAQLASSGPKGTPADYTATGVDTMRAINGGRTVQQLGQTMLGVPFAGTPLAQAFTRRTGQGLKFLQGTAGRFGDADNAATAGAPIASLNDAAAAAVDQARQSAAARIQELAGEYGPKSDPAAAGEAMQTGLRRFAGVDHHAPILDVSAFPVRASSFGAKSEALYGKAFDRLEAEIPGGVRQTGDTPIGGAQPRNELDDILDAARSGRLPKVASRGPSLTEFIAKNGGVRDDTGDLAAMDADKFHLGKPFMRKVINPKGASLGDMAQTAYDAGYFPDVAPPAWDSPDQMQALSGQDLAEAIREELAGKKRFARGGDAASYRDEGVRSTMDFLDRHGIDPKDRTNDQIRMAQERVGQGRSPDAKHINPSATRAVLKDINDRAQSPHIRGLVDAPQVRQLAKAVAESDSLSFNDLRTARTFIRYAQKDPQLSERIGMADLQRLESSLTEDIGTNAERLASPGAARALRRADRFYAAGQTRIARSLKSFEGTPQRSGENTFSRVLNAASNGASADIVRLRGLKRSLQPEDWNEVASTLITHMGSGRDGEFDLGRFIKSYGKLSPAGAEEIFGGRNAELGRALRDVVGQGRAALDAQPDLHFAADSPERAFNGLLNAAKAKGGTADIGAVQRLKAALPDEAWGQVVSGVLHTLGQDGNGGFSTAKYLTEWNKLSPHARQQLFGGPGREREVAGLDSLAAVLRDQMGAEKFHNHSNSAHAGGAMVGMIEAGNAVLEGNFHHVVKMGLLGLAGRGFAKALAAPGFSREAARAAKATTPGALDGVVTRLGKIAGNNPQAAAAIRGFSRTIGRAAAAGSARSPLIYSPDARRSVTRLLSPK